MYGDASSSPIMEVFRAHRRLALHVFLAVLLIFAVGAALNLRYSASAVLAFKPGLTPSHAKEPENPDAVAWRRLNDKEITDIIEQFQLNTGMTRFFAQGQVFSYVRSNISIQPTRQVEFDASSTPEIIVSYFGPDSSAVVGVVNEIARLLTQPETTEPASTAPAKKAPQLPPDNSLADQIEKERTNLQQLAQAKDAPTPQTELQKDLQAEAQLQSERQRISDQLTALAQQRQPAATPPAGPRVQTPAAPPNPAAVALRQQITEAQARLALLRQRYTDEYPDVQQARQAVAILENKLKRLPPEPKPEPRRPVVAPAAVPSQEQIRISALEDDARARQHDLDKSIQANENEIQMLRRRMADSQAVARDYDQEQQRYNTLLKAQKDQQEAAAASQGKPEADTANSGSARFALVQRATETEAHGLAVRPRFWITGLLSGLLMAIISVFVAGLFGSAAEDDEDEASGSWNPSDI